MSKILETYTKEAKFGFKVANTNCRPIAGEIRMRIMFTRIYRYCYMSRNVGGISDAKPICDRLLTI